MKKKTLGLVLAMAFLFCGCISFQIGTTEKELIAKIAARHVGYEVEKRYPDIAIELLVLSEAVLVAEEDDVIAVAINSIAFILTDQIVSDPALAMDIQDLVGLINVKVDVEITETQMKVINAVAQGLIEGIELFRKGKQDAKN